jgi:hypothetical protein
MEYLLYIVCNDSLAMSNNSNHVQVHKLVQVLKPLNLLEPVEAPHVTEDSTVTLVVPIFEEPIGLSFLDQTAALFREDRIRLWLLLVYPHSERDDAEGMCHLN